MTDELPDGVVGPFVNSDFGDVAIATIAITGEGFSPRELKDVAEDFRKKLYQLSGISKVELLGVQVLEVRRLRDQARSAESASPDRSSWPRQPDRQARAAPPDTTADDTEAKP